MNSQSSLIVLIGCVLFIVNSIFVSATLDKKLTGTAAKVVGGQGSAGDLLKSTSDGASQCVGAANNAASEVTGTAGQQSAGLLGGVLGKEGLVSSITGEGGLVKGLLGNGGLVGGVLNSGSEGTSQCAESAKKMTGTASEQSTDLLGGLTGQDGLVGGLINKGGVVSSLTDENGLVGGLTNNIGGLVNGATGSDGLLSGVLGGGSDTASQCVETVKDTTGSTTNMTSKGSTCSLIYLEVIASLVNKKCSKCGSVDECMTLVCDTECKQTCQIALIKVIIELILDARTLGHLTTSMAPAKGSDQLFLQVLIKLMGILKIELPLSKH